MRQAVLTGPRRQAFRDTRPFPRGGRPLSSGELPLPLDTSGPHRGWAAPSLPLEKGTQDLLGTAGTPWSRTRRFTN